MTAQRSGSQVKRQVLQKLFESQVATLSERSCPDQIVRLFLEKVDEVLERACGMEICDGHLPFLPVIPLRFRSLYDLVAMIRIGPNAGVVRILPDHAHDTLTTPGRPYYIFDVADGNPYGSPPLEDAVRILGRQGRSPLTVAEVSALCVHTDVLLQHAVAASGTACSWADTVPFVFLNTFSQPTLRWALIKGQPERLGVASCSGSRI